MYDFHVRGQESCGVESTSKAKGREWIEITKTPREEFEGPRETFEVESLEAALALAQQFLDEGRYDWFRGQVAPWVPHSSLFRCFLERDQSEYQEARRSVDWLIDWARGIPQLAELANGKQSYGIQAIAQHYQIPTNLIDFTTSPRVAGYFAADSQEQPTGGTSCIYCLNTERLEDVWSRIRAARHEQALIETVQINVENLWRLEAQCGVFLHANYQWDADYPMDRILFPYPGPLSEEQTSEIYPQGKSPLEQLLDQQFSRMPFLAIRDSVLSYIEQHSPESTFTIIPTCAADSDPSVFINGSRPALLPSWNIESLSDWRKSVVENYHDAVGHQRTIDLSDADDDDQLPGVLKSQIAKLLRAEAELRTKDVIWELHGLADAEFRRDLEEALRHLWNGMRRLPYSNDEISESAGSVAALMVSGFHRDEKQEPRSNGLPAHFQKTMLIGLASEDGSSAHAYVDPWALWCGVRPDLAEVLTVVPGDLGVVFATVNDPRLVFEFAFIKERFVFEIIPSQVVRENSLTIFNPATLVMLGYP